MARIPRLFLLILFLILLILLAPAVSWAQCGAGGHLIYNPISHQFDCTGNTGAGTGTLTNFSSSNLTPLFTTSVANATSTPALTFTLTSQNANLVYAGPVSGGAAAPTFRSLVTADLPAAGIPAPGSSGQVVWNNSGVLGADSGLAYNSGTKALGVIGTISTGQPGTASGQINFNGTTSGTVSLKSAAAAGTWTLTLPTTAGTNLFFLQTDGTGNTTWAAGGGGSGTVTSVSFTGGLISVATATTTPAFTVAGTSGGIPYFSSASAWLSSAALGANLPLIGGGAGAAPTTGTRSGNTTTFATTTGTLTPGHCVSIDTSGNLVDSTVAGCGGGGTPTWQLSGSTILSSSTFNVIPGTGLSLALTNVGGVATFTPSANFAVTQSHALTQAGGDLYCLSSTGTTSGVCALSTTLTAYSTGMVLYLNSTTSSTTTFTINVDTLGVKTVTRADGSTAVGTDVVAGQTLPIWYDGTVFREFSGTGSGGGSPAFSAITSATNSTAAMVCGTGCSIDVSGSGANNATKIGGITVTGTPSIGQSPVATSTSAATWQTPAGGGTVTVVGAGSLTSTAVVTGGGSQALQTPSATTTLDSSGNVSTPGSVTTGAGGSVGGALAFAQGTATTAPTSSVGFQAPTSVTTKFMMTLPAAPTTGYVKNTGTTDPSTISFAATIPVGDLSGLGTGVGTFLTTPSSANLATALTDETGTGALVFATSPTLVTPLLGTPTSGVLTNTTGYLWSALASPPFISNPQTTTYQVLAADFTQCKNIPVASGTFTITLVASGTQPANGTCLSILNYGSGVVTIARSGQNINGAAANLTLAAGSASAPTGLRVVSDGTNYFAQPLGASGGGSGTVTVVGAGSLTSTALVTGGGSQTIQTPSATATLDSSGNFSTPGTLSVGAGGSVAGTLELVQGTAPSLGTTSVKFYAPTSVTSYAFVAPTASATGFILGTDASNINTLSFVGFSGTGNVARVATPTFTGAPAAPTPAATDNSTTIATTAYVTTAVANAVAAVNPAVAVQAATAAALPAVTYSNGAAGVGATLTQNSAAVLVVDGYTVLLNDRLLIKNQASTFQNGVYTVTTLGTGSVPFILTRASDFNTPSAMNNTGLIPVDNNGTVSAKTGWYMTSIVTTVGTDAITFTQFAVNSANIVTASSPGAGIARFAGSTQAVTSAELSGDATTSGSNTVTVGKLNGVSLAGLATGILKNTTGTGVPSIAVAGDFPTLNQNTTGTAATITGLLGSANIAKADVMDTSSFCVDAGSTDAYACNLSPAITAYVTGTHYRFKANTVNTGTATINFNSVGAQTIVKLAGAITTTLANNDIRAGQWVEVVWDGTNMQMESQLGNAATGTGDVVGPSSATDLANVCFDGTTGKLIRDCFDATKTGGLYMQGVTSGGVALSVADVAGTAITYLWPTTNGATDQFLMDSGSVACPTLPTGFPATCHQMIWNTNFTVNSSGLASKIDGLTTAGVGMPIVLFATDVTAQSTSQSAVTIATAPAAGVYRLSYYADQTGLCTTGSNSVSFTFNWTDAGAARSLTTGSLTLGTAQVASGYISGGPFTISVASGNVTYTSTLLGTCASGTSTYEIRPTLERVK